MPIIRLHDVCHGCTGGRGTAQSSLSVPGHADFGFTVTIHAHVMGGDDDAAAALAANAIFGDP